jgi:hypothetical protein
MGGDAEVLVETRNHKTNTCSAEHMSVFC